MPRKLILAVVLVVAAAVAAGAVALGGPSEDDFRQQAMAACDRIATREAQRVYQAVPKRAIESHRKRVSAALADLRKVEPTGDARPAWEKAKRMHTAVLRDVDRALRETNGREAHDRSLLDDVDPKADDLIDDAGGQYRKAGVPDCSLRRNDTLQAADVYREKADRSCARFVRAPLIAPRRYGEGKAASLSLLKSLEREIGRMDPPKKPPKALEPLYRRELLDRLERIRDRIAEARARIRDGASPAPVTRRVLRAYDTFYDAYFEATYTLRFDECLEEQGALAEQATAFRRKARRTCKAAVRAISSATDRQTLDGFREAHRREGQLLGQLRKLRPAPRQRLQFRRALTAADAVRDLLGEVLGRYGTLTQSQANDYDRRLTKLSRRARLAFAPLNLNECGRAF